VELVSAGHDVVIIDNLANSKISVLSRLEKITGKTLPFVQLDVADRVALTQVFNQHQIDGVIHFAGLKAVGESVAKPLKYYQINLNTTLTLCEVMQEKAVSKLIFSSSATVYGDPSELPLKETSRIGVGITNPYGQTKYMIEQILQDLALSDTSWQITALRYFNPIGAHESGTIGEDPNDTPNNLLPYVSQVAAGKLEELSIYGDDYETTDGTGVRDYIHVVDLAKGHVAALEHDGVGFDAINLGTGKGTSVLELVNAFEEACGKSIPNKVVPRRPGDIATCYADPGKARKKLGWKAEKSIQEACIDSWRWQQFAMTLQG
jgi:UDP-glucose 4-epimerase